MPSSFPSLLGDLSRVAPDHVRDVAETKRVLERWMVDPGFRRAFFQDPATAVAGLGVSLTAEQVLPFLGEDSVAEDRRPAAGARPPRSVLRYQAFMQEKIGHRERVRAAGEAADPRMAAWRRRQLNRCTSELGLARATAIVHAPAAFELSKGCTVGCWFCGVAAPRFDHTWAHTAEHAALFRQVLTTMYELLGPCLRQGFLYWATDPLDNPDYEDFLRDFHDVVGRCPQTTTALAHKDVDRTRGLLELTRSLGSEVDRFSIIATGQLDVLHEALTAEEMLRVECIPQNKGAAAVGRKSNAGRARRFAAKRAEELTSDDLSSTIACVSGFLFNMVDRSVQLITPCNASDDWPLGYWVLDSGTFDTAADLRELTETMISRHMRSALRAADVVRARRDLTLSVEDGFLRARSREQVVRIGDLPDPETVADLLTRGDHTAEDFAAARARTGVPFLTTMAMLDGLFTRGLLDEEPPPASRAVPVTIEGAAR
ncbi:hypothetical protein GCM10010129_24470 [Streptomyces fumigatiscleroticus]|nr:hypothetical protein GCM10010129_24470 [Streptomyces fumigatiscleroticus]